MDARCSFPGILMCCRFAAALEGEKEDGNNRRCMHASIEAEELQVGRYGKAASWSLWSKHLHAMLCICEMDDMDLTRHMTTFYFTSDNSSCMSLRGFQRPYICTFIVTFSIDHSISHSDLDASYAKTMHVITPKSQTPFRRTCSCSFQKEWINWFLIQVLTLEVRPLRWYTIVPKPVFFGPRTPVQRSETPLYTKIVRSSETCGCVACGFHCVCGSD